MNISQPIASSIASVSFSALHASDVRRISVKQVVNPVLFDNQNRPTAGGLYDPCFGPLSKGDICSTCRLSSFDCPGHFGHIDLPMPVFHPLYMTQAYQLLRGTCTYCHHFLIPEHTIIKYVVKLRLLEHGLVSEADEVEAIDIKAEPKRRSKMSVAYGDNELGDSTDETVAEFRARMIVYFQLCMTRAGLTGEDDGRDGYKRSGLAFDRRRKVMAEFLKTLVKKKCGRCGAFAHRLKKEGHTRLIEYSLVMKQKSEHKAAGIVRKDLPALEREWATVGARHDRMDLDDDDDASSSSSSSSSRGNDNLFPDPPAANSDSEEEEDDGNNEDDISVDSDLTPSGRRKSDLRTPSSKQTERILTPSEVRLHLRLLFRTESELLSLLYSPHGPLSLSSNDGTSNADMFFMDVVAVPPTRFRPAATMGDKVFENPQNQLLNGVLRQTFTVRDLSESLKRANAAPPPVLDGGKEEEKKSVVDKTRLYTQLLESLIGLQVAVNSLVDSGKNPMIVRGGKEPPPGIKQLLEKKDGLFRKNMMGKRVNYAARSVISPDVNIETNEIGVPPIFARKLTFPEPVTPHNVQQLRRAVINGPHLHPGASFIQTEDGNLTSLDKLTIEQRTALANQLLTPAETQHRTERPEFGLPQTRTPQVNKKVYRHLVDGDIVILNRQPTLHKPSMMCHRVKVLKGEKTIRMHYANCNSYNADFDGDEMNMHFPQSLVAQAEARLLANTDNQYLVPTSGNPLRGLIQDHVVAGVWLTNVDTFFTRQEYFQLIYGALRPENDYSGGGTVLTVPPAIQKPRPLWTGKQVISTILKNIKPTNAAGISFHCKTKVPGSAWGPQHPEEDLILFDDGDLLTGVLDKAQIGASAFGLVHSVHELYGPESAGKLLSILSRLLTKFLQSRAFTCRMDDLLLTEQGNADRRLMLAAVNEKGLDAALDYVGLGDADKAHPDTADGLRARLEEILRDDYKLAGLDATVEGETNQVTTQLIKTCLPGGLVKPFPHNNMQTMTVSGAKGSNVNASQISCLLGQQSLEGRRVPTMVSGKTLPSFKAFETAPRAGGFVAGRFLTGIRPQEYYFHCMAGREGLIDTAVKTSRSGYLQRCLIKHLEGLRVHYDHTVRNSDSSVLQFHYGEDSLDVTRQKHLTQFEFAARNAETFIHRFHPQSVLERVEDIGKEPVKDGLKHPDTVEPVLSRLSPSTHLGSVSEKYAALVEKYIKDNPHRLLMPPHAKRSTWPAYIDRRNLMKRDFFRSLMYMRYMRSLVDPGEAVGLMASQGVGEPSTQMTLNTFHFAGHGAANVTLGIPRLREIVMTASQNIKTPTMKLPVLDTASDAAVQELCQKATRLTLSQVVDKVVVSEHLSPKSEANGFTRYKLYTIRLELYPKADYAEEYSIRPYDVLVGIEKTFVPQLDRAILREIKQNDKELKAEASDIGKARSKVSEKAAAKAAAAAAAEGDDAEMVSTGRDDEEPEDGDADDQKRHRQKQDESDDDDEDADSDSQSGEARLEAAFADSDASDVSDADSESEDEEKMASTEKGKLSDEMRKIQRRCAASSRYVDAIRFDVEGGQWCEFDMEFSSRSHKLLLVGIVERICRSSIVHEISGIARCFVAKAVTEQDAKNRTVMTEGVNLRACWNFAYDVVDLNEIYTNDIGAILRTYGVEAARTAIIKEMSGVFGAYGIGVDFRHLTIIADYMTCEGGYKPFNRTGLSNNSSPFLKASFETTANFVAEAALYGDFDDLGTPSANIVLGQVPQSGTGVFAVCSVQEV